MVAAAVNEAGPSASNGRHIPRAPLVSQVDAGELDDGIAQLLGDGVERAFARFHPSIGPDAKPEIELVMKLAVFAVGVLGPSTASPGHALSNLRLASKGTRPSRNKLLLYILLHPPLIPRYLLTRARVTALSRQWPDLPAHDIRRKLWRLLTRIEAFAQAWELAGWGWFLLDGRYPSLLMRILKLRLVPNAPHLARMVSYEFMNRQLVWGVMTEFLMFALPRIPSLPHALNPNTLLGPVRTFLNQPTTIDYDALSAAQGSISAAKAAGVAAPSAAHAGICAGIPLQTCPVCYLRRTSAPVALSGTDIELPALEDADPEADPEDRIFIPAQTDCWGGCSYCYYCIADELAQFAQDHPEKDARWQCLRCGGNVSKAKRASAEPGALQRSEESEESSEEERETEDDGEGRTLGSALTEGSWFAV
ncbi:hypothetical protein CspeluHIS016_0109190 [Cutaneotrichosporon spelunceum]|uniref:RING-type E3 ubiquitin transferase (cysteine targeting) n=1 Tax=Cutaneotrichosporon spelunceum TaxID=1672016 RepID=A0AAD3TPL0_9TREE|nr:hypothetical protein CspeluHIS016_0109190 [Cutaneotrichosporon spelunceum]